jgi:outer membrane protein OmpA-like peptidoglycan-associated protein
MKQPLIFLLALSLTLLTGGLQAQNGSARWALGLGPRLLTYQAHPGQPKLGYSTYDPAGQLTVGRYLSSAFDFRSHLTFSPKVSFPATEQSTRNAWLLDMSYNLVFKFYNGALLRESARVGPYLMVGLGGSYVQDNPDAYVPLGVGLRIRLNHRMSLHLESVRQLSLNQDYQHLSHVVSFVYNLGGENPPKKPKPDKVDEEQLTAMAPTDTDGDGVMDEFDDCPDTPGEVNLQGCPPEDDVITEETTNTVAEVDDLGLEDNTFGQSEDDAQAGSFADNGTSANSSFSSQNMNDGSGPCVSLSNMEVEPVFFTYGSDELLPETKARLDRLAELMKGCDNMRLVLNGHTDDTGTERDNLTLSVMRAFRVKYYLVYQHDIRQSRITSGGMGEEKPISTNDSESARKRNRRVDFELTL